jgi:hypothetical protein
MRACQNHNECRNCTLRVEITLVGAVITLVSVIITRLSVEMCRKYNKRLKSHSACEFRTLCKETNIMRD